MEIYDVYIIYASESRLLNISANRESNFTVKKLLFIIQCISISVLAMLPMRVK